MAYSVQSPERRTSTPREECEYQSSPFQWHKHFHGRKGLTIYGTQTPAAADWANIKTHGSASVSDYKKVNVKPRRPVPLAGARRICVDNWPQQSNVKSAALFAPVVLDLQESKPLTYNTPSDQLPYDFASRSSRMYLNPHFLKSNSSLPSVTAKHITSEDVSVCTSKHSVHINPKVLAEQVMKLTTQSQPKRISVPASGCGVSKKLGARLPPGDLLLESSSANLVNTRYAFQSRTKLVKHNAVIHQTNTGNVLRNSGSSSQSVPKRNSCSLKSSLPGPLLSVSRTKMVRAKPTAPRPCLQGFESNRLSGSVPDDSSTPLTTSRRWSVSSCSRTGRNSFKFSTVAVKVAKAVCSKYKLNRSMSKTPAKSVSNCATNKSVLNQVSRYKIDRRLHKTPKRLKNVKKYSLRYQTPKQGNRNPQNRSPKLFSRHKNVQHSFKGLKFSNKMWNKSLCPRKELIMENKLRRIGNSPSVRKSRHQENMRQSSNLVQIGGVLYRTSKLKLTRSLTPKSKNEVTKQSANVFKPRSPVAVYVRGNKFLMDATGKTLLRVPQSTTSAVSGSTTRNMPLKRIDIGGVTFVQKSTNVLVRTNTHNTRSRLSQAKQKSIALLTKKMKKSNQPCTFYHHFGKCTRKEMGTCPHVHDPKHVAVCWKFLQGSCTVTDCSLSHEVRPEKMPTCKYFLEGCCVRDNCPYLHVKVSAKAGICKNFLHGYCPDGQKCRKQHSYLCPEFEKAGSCPKGKYCAYPHKSVVENRAQTEKHKRTAGKACAATGGERKRYYEMGEIVSLVHGAEQEDPQVACQAESNDLNEKAHDLLKQDGDTKRESENAQCHMDGQMVAGPDLKHEPEDAKAKRPKLGILPAYIPLGPSP